MEFKHIFCWTEINGQGFNTNDLENHLKDGWKIVTVMGTANNYFLISRKIKTN